MSKRIAFFDFDGTITTHDTLLEFIKFSHGTPKFYLGFLLHAPWLLAYKGGLITNQKAKEKILSWFFGGLPLSRFQETCRRFSETALPALLRRGAMEEIGQLRESGATIVVVSASPGNWIEAFAGKIGADLIATRLEIKDEKLTGRIEGNNCYGQEKVARIREKYDIAAYDEVRAYGDSKGDLPMLKLAKQEFYKPFR